MIREGPQPRRPVLVSFSGMDGAGKSTQISRLYTRLQQSGLRVSLITFWDDVARLKAIREKSAHTLFRGDKGVGTPAAPIHRRDKNVQSWPMTCVRLCLYFVDAVSLRLVVEKVLRSQTDIILFDRYAYDELVNLNLHNPVLRVYLRLILCIVPAPDVSYLLDADPVEARARKPEYPLDFLYTCRASYLTLSTLVGSMTVIAPMPISAAERLILEGVHNRLPHSSLSAEPTAGIVGEDHS